MHSECWGYCKMQTFLLCVIIGLLLSRRIEEAKFRRVMLFQFDEIHIRLSEKQDRQPRHKKIIDSAYLEDL